MTWYVGAFEKTGDEFLVKQLPTVGIDEDFIREVWALPSGYQVNGGGYNITPEHVGRVQSHVAEKIDLDAYTYQLFDEGF